MILTNDQIYFFVWLCMSIPFSMIYKSLPNGRKFIWMKHTLGLTWSYIAYLTMFGNTAFFIGFIPVIIIWIIGKIMINIDNDKKRGFVCLGVWIGCLIYLSAFHINRMMIYWLLPVIDSTTTHMMITIKLTQFITEQHYKRYNNRYPSLLEWIGFIYFIPSMLVGPTCTLEEYQTFITYNNTDTTTQTKKQTSSLFVKASILLVLGCIGLWIYPPTWMLTDMFSNLTFFKKLLFVYISMLLIRCKFYFIWTISEIAYIVSGSSTFVKFKGRNVDILETEFPTNIYGLTNGWNKRTNEWLKNCVYKPLESLQFQQIYCILVTNLISAVWHGFYPGYYITFIFGGVCTLLGRIWRKQISSRINKIRIPLIVKIYNLLKIPIMILIISFGAIPFNLCSLQYTIQAFNKLQWYGVIIITIGWTIIGIVNIVPRFINQPQMFDNTKNE